MWPFDFLFPRFRVARVQRALSARIIRRYGEGMKSVSGIMQCRRQIQAL